MTPGESVSSIYTVQVETEPTESGLETCIPLGGYEHVRATDIELLQMPVNQNANGESFKIIDLSSLVHLESRWCSFLLLV